MKRTILVASLALIPLILPGLTSAAPQVTEPMSSAEAQAQGLTQIAVGSVKDTLKACLGRIPQDASTGQLMLAEGSCQQVENGRIMSQTSELSEDQSGRRRFFWFPRGSYSRKFLPTA